MASQTVFHLETQGWRDAQGRFTRASDTLVAASLEEAGKLAHTAVQTYRTWAPRSRPEASATGIHFRDTFSSTVTPTSGGFRIDVMTTEGQLATWLREGTGVYAGRGRIYPRHTNIKHGRNVAALGPIFNWTPKGTGPFWFRSIAGMRANDWEQKAFADMLPLAERAANQVAVKVKEVFGA